MEERAVMSSIRYGAWLVAAAVLLVTPLFAASRPAATSQHVYVALYQRGPAWKEGESVHELPDFEEHVAHIRAIEARLLGSGPFIPNEGAVGMIIFLATGDDEAQALAESDPFARAQYTRVTQVLRWDIDRLKGWP
jgi:uncharacterized protein YciI